MSSITLKFRDADSEHSYELNGTVIEQFKNVVSNSTDGMAVIQPDILDDSYGSTIADRVLVTTDNNTLIRVIVDLGELEAVGETTAQVTNLTMDWTYVFNPYTTLVIGDDDFVTNNKVYATIDSLNTGTGVFDATTILNKRLYMVAMTYGKLLSVIIPTGTFESSDDFLTITTYPAIGESNSIANIVLIKE